MLIRKPSETQSKPMTMPGADRVQMRLMVGRDDGAPNFSMRVFDVEAGGQTPTTSTTTSTRSWSSTAAASLCAATHPTT